MKYKVVDMAPLTRKGEKYVVHELQTSQDIRAFTRLCDANNFARHLNRGACFDGWTPNFFLNDSKKVGVNA